MTRPRPQRPKTTKKTNPKPKKAAPAPTNQNQEAPPRKLNFCYFYNKGLRDGGHTVCTRKNCTFPHERMSDEDWNKAREAPPMKRSVSAASERSSRRRTPTPGGSRSTSRGSKGSHKPGRGRSTTRKGRQQDVKHCFAFLKEGRCNADGCTFPHLSKEQLAAERKKRRNTSRGSKGSSRPNKTNKSK